MIIVSNPCWTEKEIKDAVFKVNQILDSKLALDVSFIEKIYFLNWKKLVVLWCNGGKKKIFKISLHYYGRKRWLNELWAFKYLSGILHSNVIIPKMKKLYDDGVDIVVVEHQYIELGRRLSYFKRPSWYDWVRKGNSDMTQGLYPSHGDFVSWNVFKNKDGFSVIDFEYFSPKRPIFYDEWHWFVFPVVSWVIRRLKWRLRLPPLVWNGIFSFGKRYLQRKVAFSDDLFLLSFFQYLCLYREQLKKEHTIEDAVVFIGSKPLNLGKTICDIYSWMIDDILEILKSKYGKIETGFFDAMPDIF